MARKPTRRKPIKKSSAKRSQKGTSGGGTGGGSAQGPASSTNNASARTIDGKSDEPKTKQIGPFEFGQQVIAEGSKVTWTTRNETVISTVMVLIMVAVMSAFFFLVDMGLRAAVCNILPIECVS